MMREHRVMSIDEPSLSAAPDGLGFSGLVLRAQTAGAEVEVPGLAFDIDGGGVDIGNPAAVGMALGVADVLTEKRGLAA